jgi:ubiquitin
MALGMFSRSVVSQIPLTLQWSKVTESVTRIPKGTEKIKEEADRNQSGKGGAEAKVERKGSLKHSVQLIACFCTLLNAYSFQRRVVVFPRMKITNGDEA